MKNVTLLPGGEMKLISLKNDYAFRELFSYENVRKQFLSDVLRIPLEEIKEVRMISPFLWKRWARQKLGILDMALELNGGTKINVEMQVRCQKHWIKRALFYLAKMFTEDLKMGQDYGRLRRCISISLLDFRLLEGDEYHSVYRLRKSDGTELTDLLEMHIIELPKILNGLDPVDDWIRLFNVESEDELKMINAKNAGIREAVAALRSMSLRKNLRYLYEARMKMIRDRRAEDEYVRDEGRMEGIDIGIGKGMAQMTVSLVRKKAAKNMSVSEIADWLEAEETVIRRIYNLLKAHPDWDDKRICDELKG